MLIKRQDADNYDAYDREPSEFDFIYTRNNCLIVLSLICYRIELKLFMYDYNSRIHMIRTTIEKNEHIKVNFIKPMFVFCKTLYVIDFRAKITSRIFAYNVITKSI